MTSHWTDGASTWCPAAGRVLALAGRVSSICPTCGPVEPVVAGAMLRAGRKEVVELEAAG